jgi:hypothetical protein
MKKPTWIYTFTFWNAEDVMCSTFVRADSEREAFILARQENPNLVDIELINRKLNETDRERKDREYRQMLERQKGTKTWVKQDQPSVRV